jgi:SagB-type dehydrogenase family enzyme
MTCDTGLIARHIHRATLCALAAVCLAPPACMADDQLGSQVAGRTNALQRGGTRTALESLLAQRRSVRSFAPAALSRQTLGELAWSAQGVTSPRGFRTAPSAGALYPLELYVADGEGVYHYICDQHAFATLTTNDIRAAIGAAAYNQRWVTKAPAQFIFSAVHTRATRKYGQRGIRYTDMEAGHAAQNLMLRAVELGLGTVAIGAFDAAQAGRILGLKEEEVVLYIICVGQPSSQ